MLNYLIHGISIYLNPLSCLLVKLLNFLCKGIVCVWISRYFIVVDFKYGMLISIMFSSDFC